MRIASIELAGNTKPGSNLPAAFAVLTRPFDQGCVRAEIHQPGGRTRSISFIPGEQPFEGARWADASRELAEKLDGDVGGAKAILQLIDTMITMGGPAPEQPAEQDDRKMVAEAMQNMLSPEAVAAISYILRCTVTGEQTVNRQIRWIEQTLAEMVGGTNEVDRIAEEIKTHIG